MADPTEAEVQVDGRGVAWIPRANTKIREIVCAMRAHGYTPEALHDDYPHLSMAQILAALAYYRAHRAEIDADIEAELVLAEKIRRATAQAPVAEALVGSMAAHL